MTIDYTYWSTHKFIFKKFGINFGAFTTVGHSGIGLFNKYLHTTLYIFFFNRNPNEAQKQESVLPISRERNRYKSIVWDEYDTLHQKYLEIGKISLID